MPSHPTGYYEWRGVDRTGTRPQRWICQIVGHDMHRQPSHIQCVRCKKLAFNRAYMRDPRVPLPPMSREDHIRYGWSIAGEFPDEAKSRAHP